MSSKRLIIDVRESFEYKSGHVEGALHIPLAALMSGAPELNDVDKDTELIVYCRTGNRSGVAAQALQQMGFTNVANGINADYIAKNHLG